MSKDNLQDNLYWNLLQVSMRSKKSLMKFAEDHDLNIMQLFVLGSIKKGEAVPTNFISSLLTCDASTVTGIVDFLCAQGFMARVESAEDRRVKMLVLTDEGERVKEEILDAIRNFGSHALDGLNDEQKIQLQDLLSIVIRTASK